jgi:hypothetical protein
VKFRLPEEYQMWCGRIFPPQHFKELYNVDDVFFSDELCNQIEDDLNAEGKNSSAIERLVIVVTIL